MLIRTLTDKALLITASKVRYKKDKTKSLVKFMFICSTKNQDLKSSEAGSFCEWMVSDQE